MPRLLAAFMFHAILFLPAPFHAEQDTAPQAPKTMAELAQEASALSTELEAHFAAGRLEEADAVAKRIEGLQRQILERIEKQQASLKSLHSAYESYLSTTRTFRADRAEERDDLDAAVTARREIVQLLSGLMEKDNWELVDARRRLADAERNRKRPPDERRDLAEAKRLGPQVVRLCRQGKWSEARPLAEKAVSIRERLLGKASPDYAASLSNLADVYDSLGDETQSEALYRQALAVRRDSEGTRHPNYAQALHNLAFVLVNRGDDDRAASLYREALRIEESVLGKMHPLTVDTRSNLGTLFLAHGDYEKAEPLLEAARDVTKAIYGESHADYATRLVNLAALYDARGDTVRAETLYKQVLTIREKALGVAHPAYSAVLNDLAAHYHAKGEYTKAEPLLVRATELSKQAVGESHPLYARCLHNLAGLYEAQGDHARAEPLYRQALKLRKELLGEDHPSYARTLEDYALLCAAQGRWDESIDNEDRTRRIFRHHIGHVVPALSEREQLIFLGKVDRTSLWTAYSLGLARRDDPAAAAKSADWILNGKALSQQALAERTLLARESRDQRFSEIVRELKAVRARLANAVVSTTDATLGPGAKREALLESLKRQEQEFVARLSLARGIVHRTDSWVTADEVRKAVAADSVLVEFARFGVFDFQHGNELDWWRAPHYAAWVIPPLGKGDVQLIDLGSAEAIEQAVAEYRTAMRSAPATITDKGEPAAEAELRKPLKALAARVLRPLEAVLAKTPHWQLSPDAALWLIPWGALPLQDGAYALEKHAITYRVSGRELVTSSSARPTPHSGLLVADPDFDAVAESPPDAKPRGLESGLGGASSTSAIPTNWPRLPGTAAEAAAILPRLERFLGAKPAEYTGSEAVEDVVRRAPRPRVMLLCTHGFFLPDQPFAATGQRPSSESESAKARPMENPLLRCGLVLAGANQRILTGKSDDDDGILTGLEVVGTDLRGTELAVLSACETGLGDLRQGEGVAGLRQAFQLAGARIVIASLWQVPDEETVELMTHLWEELNAGRPLADALLQAQRTVIRTRREAGRAAHPLFWAAFTVTGSVRPGK